MESTVARSTATLVLLVLALVRGESLPDLPRLLASRLARQGTSSCARDSRIFLGQLGNFSVDAVSSESLPSGKTLPSSQKVTQMRFDPSAVTMLRLPQEVRVTG